MKQIKLKDKIKFSNGIFEDEFKLERNPSNKNTKNVLRSVNYGFLTDFDWQNSEYVIIK